MVGRVHGLGRPELGCQRGRKGPRAEGRRVRPFCSLDCSSAGGGLEIDRREQLPVGSTATRGPMIGLGHASEGEREGTKDGLESAKVGEAEGSSGRA